jgi:hypothetical protein
MDKKAMRGEGGGGWSNPYRKKGPAFLTHQIPYEQLYTPKDALGTSGNWIITFVTLLPRVTFRNPISSTVIYDPEQISTHLPAKYEPNVTFACGIFHIEATLRGHKTNTPMKWGSHAYKMELIISNSIAHP